MAAVESRAADEAGPAGTTAGASGAAQPGPEGAHDAFEAMTPSGPVRLVFDNAVAPRCAAEAALQLARAEPLLVALDDWLADAGEGLDWRWSPQADARADAVAWAGAATARWPAASGEGVVRLGVPWALLRRCGEPPAALALAWVPVPAVCVLAALDLTRDELAALEPGGVLLLPASFEPPWTGRLRADGEARGQGLPIAWVDPERPTPWRGETLEPAGGAVPPAGDLEVRRTVSACLEPGALAGWARAGAWYLPALRPDVGLWVCRRGVETCLAHGRLVPWGRGRAMLIDGLGAPPRPGDARPISPDTAPDAAWT